MIRTSLENLLWIFRRKNAASIPVSATASCACAPGRHRATVKTGFQSFALALIVVQAMPYSCPPPPIPIASFSPSGLTFPPQVVSPGGPASAAQIVTLTNVGTGNLDTTTLVASGDYSQTNDCPSSLAPKTSCTIEVIFTPNAIGTINGAITLTEAFARVEFVSLSGVGLAPVGFSPARLDFGTIAPGASSVAQTVTLTNNQSPSLAVNSVSTSGNYSQTNNCPASLATGQSCSIDVTFSPTLSGSIPGALTVITDASLGTQPVALGGIGSGSVVPDVSFTPATLAFGNLEAGTASATQTVTLTNTSASSSLTINTVSIPGASYSETDTCAGQIIPPSGTCTVNVTFQPSPDFAPVGYPAAITISDSDSTSPQVVGLSGTAVAPVSASQDDVQFGTVYNGATSAPQTVTVTNNHNAAEDVSIAVGGGYVIESNNCPPSVPAGGQCDLGIQKTAGGDGVTNSAVTLTPSSGDFLSPHVISLSACSTAVVLTPPGLNFGDVSPGTASDPQTATITNGGFTTLNLTDISISGANASEFSISNNTCGAVLPSGQSCIVSTVFNPASSGAKNATLTFGDDAACNPQTVGLTAGSSAGPFTISVFVTGNGVAGTVTSDLGGINCGSNGTACSAPFTGGSTVTLTAAPDAGVPFVGWFGACTGTGSCVLDMLADKQVVAVFGANPILEVDVGGNGAGTVTSTPAGINCGSTCLAEFAPETVVTLTATPAAGSSFAGWYAGCVGTGQCTTTVLGPDLVGANFVTPDFSLDVPPPAPAAVSPGQSAVSTVTVTSLGGFNSAVSLTCSVQPAPSLAPTCSLNPASATPAADGSVTSTLTISTVAQTASARPHAFGNSGLQYALWLPVAGFAWLGIGFASRRGKKAKLLGLWLGCSLFIGLAFQAACGGSSTIQRGSTGTPKDTYTITITGTSGALQHSTLVTLRVQ
jgi:hypothetical protein